MITLYQGYSLMVIELAEMYRNDHFFDFGI